MTAQPATPPCHFCSGPSDRSVLVELPVTRITASGQLVTRQERRVWVCNQCGKTRKRRFPAARKAKDKAWSDWWAKQQEGLF